MFIAPSTSKRFRMLAILAPAVITETNSSGSDLWFGVLIVYLPQVSCSCILTLKSDQTVDYFYSCFKEQIEICKEELKFSVNTVFVYYHFYS